MANVANNFKYTRVNINIPTTLVQRVKEYADNLGMPYTQTYVLLLNSALDNASVIKELPKIITMINELKEYNTKNNITNE